VSWTTSTLGDVLAVIKNGINCEQNKIPVGNKITRIETIARKVFDFERVGYADLTEAEREKSKLKKGDILFSHINSPIHVGKTAIYDGEEDIYHGINLLLMRTIESVDPYFFNLYLNYLFATGYWKANCKQSVNQASVNQKDISKVKFCYPPLATQKKIVAKLDAIFAEIDKATAAAETNAKNSEALFQSYSSKVFEEIKKTWDEKILSEICDVRDGTHDSPKYVEQGIPFVTQKNIRKDGLNLNDVKFITDDDHNKFYKRSNVAYGDILISMIGANRGMSAIVDDVRLFSIKNVCLVKQGNKADQNYLLYFFRSVQAQNYIQLFSNGGAQEFIGLTALRKLPIPMPSKEVQEKVVDSLNTIFSLSKVIENNTIQKLNSLVKLKQAILKQAFNGELVKD
jgi:type I restriction enzyme S subunit